MIGENGYNCRWLFSVLGIKKGILCCIIECDPIPVMLFTSNKTAVTGKVIPVCVTGQMLGYF